MGVDWTRVSCRVNSRLNPLACVNYVRDSTRPGIQKYFLYMSLDHPATLLNDARQFSMASRDVPQIEEIGMDDFFGAYEDWFNRHIVENPPEFLGQLIDALKHDNPQVKFGITLYENEMDSVYNPFINDAHLPPAIREKFDYIHLFLHYRKNGPRFADYVAQAKALFPHAQIIAGVYGYDRIDYFPCAQGDRRKKSCSEKEEMALFKQALDIQMQLLQSGQVVGLELYPGYFGAEQKLSYGPGSHQLTCKKTSRCIQNSQTMRDLILQAHQQSL